MAIIISLVGLIQIANSIQQTGNSAHCRQAKRIWVQVSSFPRGIAGNNLNLEKEVEATTNSYCTEEELPTP